MSSCRATNAKAMAAEIARLRALVMAADTLAEAACNLDDYSQDDPEGPELEASVAAYVEMRRGYEPTDARPEPTATVERVTSEVARGMGTGEELVTKIAHGAEVREIVARGMGTGEPRCVECRHPIGSVAHVDCDAPTLGIVGRSSGYTPTPEPEPACTGFAASWCPVHGECRCPPLYGDPNNGPTLDDPSCPLHAPGSAHAAEPAPEPERTPETVLRAMLADYQDAALKAAMAHLETPLLSPEDTATEALADRLDEYCNEIRNATAKLLVGLDYIRDLKAHGHLADYEARLSGERPLHAPPLTTGGAQ